MVKANFLLFLVLSGMFIHDAYADDVNSALVVIQNCLKNQNCDSANSDAAKAADLQALQAVGGNVEAKRALYDLSADVMPVLVQQADGDPEKMQAILSNAQNDPESFLNSFPPDLIVKIKNAAQAVEKNRR